MNRFYSARTGAAFRPEATAEMTLVQAFSAIADFAVEAVVSPARGHIADAVFVSEIASGGKGFDLPTLSDKAAPVVAVFGMAEGAFVVPSDFDPGGAATLPADYDPGDLTAIFKLKLI